MTFEETVRSALRWHASAVSDNQPRKTVLKDMAGYNKNILESEELSLKQIMDAYRTKLKSETDSSGGA